MNQEDVDIHLENDHIVIEGKKDVNEEHDEDGRHYSERSYGYFKRSIPLPFVADSEKVSAKMKNGVLKIELNKLRDSDSDVRRISIN